MFQKKKKCGICGYRFTPQKEEVYTAEKPRSVMEHLTEPPTYYSAIDCPRCGCQIALANRDPRVTVPPTAEKDEPKRAQADAPKQYSLNVDPDTGEITVETDGSDE